MPLRPEGIRVGRVVNQGAHPNEWIITDVLGDGKFKAVQKRNFDKWKAAGVKNEQEALKNVSEQVKETFDISGKVDTNNPIYTFYEKEVGRFLKNKFGATIITDPQGVKWFQLDVKPEYKSQPVKAFGKARLPSELVKQYA